jgi:hypothetical protein
MKNKFTLVQTRLNAFRTKIIETNVIGVVDSVAEAEAFLKMREYKFDDMAQGWIKGNKMHYPVTINPPEIDSIFDIRSFG